MSGPSPHQVGGGGHRGVGGRVPLDNQSRVFDSGYTDASRRGGGVSGNSGGVASGRDRRAVGVSDSFSSSQYESGYDDPSSVEGETPNRE